MSPASAFSNLTPYQCSSLHLSLIHIYFAGVIVLVRPLIIAAYCFLGNGSIIPFSGWGIPVWLAIIAVFATLAVLSFKYQKRFEDWLFSKFSRKKGKLKKEEKAQETIETEE